MGLYSVFVFLACVAIAASSGASEPTAAQSPASGCREICKHDRDLDGHIGRCLTACTAWTVPDKIHHAMVPFVQDQALNEKGDTKMVHASEKALRTAIENCRPFANIRKKPLFKSMDKNGDQAITRKEAISYGIKMCIPDKVMAHIFSHADTDHNGKLVRREFFGTREHAGINSDVGSLLDPLTQSNKEKLAAFRPTFEDWDLNKNGVLEEAEAFNAFMYELSKQDSTGPDPEASEGIDQPPDNEVSREWEDDFARAWPHIDRDGDGVVSREEFEEDPLQDTDQVERVALEEHVAGPVSVASSHADVAVSLRGRRVSKPAKDGALVVAFGRAKGRRFNRRGRQFHSSAPRVR